MPNISLIPSTLNALNTLDTSKALDPLAGFPRTEDGFHFPHLLVSGRCSFCPDTPTGWVYADPKTGKGKTRNRVCMDCLVACAGDADADPVLAALGREIAGCRRLDDARRAALEQPAAKPPVIETNQCTECSFRGPTWSLPNGCERFCADCAADYIAWEEGEMALARAAQARLARMPKAEARPYRLLKHRPCYQIADCQAA